MSFTPHNLKIDKLKNLYQHQQVAVSVLRADLVHPIISGNKWYKLNHYLKAAKNTGKRVLLTFGGAFSNHMIATAALAQQHNFISVGIIRGEKPAALSPTLQDAQVFGMHLFYVSREDYKSKIIPIEVRQYFDEKETLVINEGGYGEAGKWGAANLLDSVEGTAYTHIAVAVGTGTTLAGLVTASLPHQKVLGISSFKNNNALQPEINDLLPNRLQNQFTIFHQYHFGGYAKYTPELIQFMNRWYQLTGIPTDFVYTAKLFFGLNNLIEMNYFKKGSSILAVHSGGLQGNRSLKKGTLIFTGF